MRRLPVLVACALLCAAVPAQADPLAPSPLVALSGGTPFPNGCPGVQGAQPGAEAESHLAVSPADPNRMVAAWQQDRTTTGGTTSMGLAASSDGGSTWRRVESPGVTTCQASPYTVTSDPWVSFGGDGTAYVASVPGHGGNPFGINSKVVVAHSADGGATWSAPVTVHEEPGQWEDKETVTADPQRPGTAYAVWSRVEQIGPGNVGDRTAFFARTADGGATWSTHVFYTPPEGQGSIGHTIVVQADGSLVDVFTQAPGENRPGRAMALRSDDGGASWSAPVVVGDVSGRQVEDAERGRDVRTGDPLVSAALDPQGHLYAVWQNPASATRGSVQIARSDDAGRSFGTPRALPRPASVAFDPVVAAGPQGVAISYYDFRFDRRRDNGLTTSMWIAHSHDAGATWSESRLGAPFDLRSGPLAGADELFLGDYTGLVGLPDGFGAAVVDARPAALQGPSDVLFSRAVPGKAPGAPALTLSPRARTLSAGRRVRVKLAVRGQVNGRTIPLPDVLVSLARASGRTDIRGRVTLTAALRARHRYRVTADLPGYRRAAAAIEVR
jgi:hypothetical protein